jgi:hypothetical protein
MFSCQWHFDIPFGKQKEVLDIMQRWEAEIQKDRDTPKNRGWRLMVGHIGVSASHIINEQLVEDVGDWDKALKVVATGRFQKYSDEIAPFIVPGSQHWVVYRIAANTPSL